MEDVQSDGFILRHKKSGARIAILSNNDDNKVFYIGFRTPPEDETGVPHIIEHTTLCGSKKFPVKDPFIEWESILTECMKTLQYSESFVSAANQASNEGVALSQQISQSFNETMDGMMSSWESRNKSQDILSQKQSDATLGYERFYDTETGEIYRAAIGFGDSYDGKRYQPVTDDNMYTEAISGYIERLG